jgi:hypothetical protein
MLQLTPVTRSAILLRRLYGIWAKYRLPITGRPDLQVVLQEKKMCRASSSPEAAKADA